MNTMRTFMRNYPMVTSAVIFPFVFIFIYKMLSLFIEIFLPIILSIWITGFVYNMLTHDPNNSMTNNIFWTTKYNK